MSELSERDDKSVDELAESSAEFGEAVRSLVRSAMSRRQQAITFSVAKRFAECFQVSGVVSGESPTRSDSGWLRIESLSQLRATVGGRFQNLKQKWTEAGFPLREHRGDREGKAEFRQEGWLELSLWINKQGYDARLARDEEPWLFEVRKSGPQ
jgi:hypothetical protein